MSKTKIWISPTEFCAYPVMEYWELNGKPVSQKEASLYGEWGDGVKMKPGAVKKETEVARNIKDYTGYFEE